MLSNHNRRAFRSVLGYVNISYGTDDRVVCSTAVIVMVE